MCDLCFVSKMFVAGLDYLLNWLIVELVDFLEIEILDLGRYWQLVWLLVTCFGFIDLHIVLTLWRLVCCVRLLIVVLLYFDINLLLSLFCLRLLECACCVWCLLFCNLSILFKLLVVVLVVVRLNVCLVIEFVYALVVCCFLFWIWCFVVLVFSADCLVLWICLVVVVCWWLLRLGIRLCFLFCVSVIAWVCLFVFYLRLLIVFVTFDFVGYLLF